MNTNLMISAGLTAGIAVADFVSKKIEKRRSRKELIIVSAEPITYTEKEELAHFVMGEYNDVTCYDISDKEDPAVFNGCINDTHGDLTIGILHKSGGQRVISTITFSHVATTHIKRLVKIQCIKEGMPLTNALSSFFNEFDSDLVVMD